MRRFITLYRPIYLVSITRTLSTDRAFYNHMIPNYRCGDLRAKLFGVRVPVLWALEKILV